MPHDELKPKDRVVLRMTRDGAVEENLTEGTSEKVSKRLEDAQLVAPHDTETGDIADHAGRNTAAVENGAPVGEFGQGLARLAQGVFELVGQDQFFFLDLGEFENDILQRHVEQVAGVIF